MPEGEVRYWNASAVTPVAPSLAVPDSVRVPISGVPGSAIVAVGAVLSTRRPLTTTEVWE